MPHNHEHHDHADAPASFNTELLDLDGEVMHEYWDSALGWVHELAGSAETIIDLGAGSGVGTLRLARLFPDARLTAIDMDEALLGRIREKAQNLDGRVSTLAADLDKGLPDVGLVDLTWASMSLHHFADPDRILREVRATTRPGGLIALAEFSEPLQLLPETITAERRWLDMLREDHHHQLPDLGSDWSPRLAGAGFDVVGERELQIRVTRQSDAAARYAQLWLQRLLGRLHDRLDETDRALLVALTADTGSDSIRHSMDVDIRGSRTVTIARAGGS